MSRPRKSRRTRALSGGPRTGLRRPIREASVRPGRGSAAYDTAAPSHGGLVCIERRLPCPQKILDHHVGLELLSDTHRETSLLENSWLAGWLAPLLASTPRLYSSPPFLSATPRCHSSPPLLASTPRRHSSPPLLASAPRLHSSLPRRRHSSPPLRAFTPRLHSSWENPIEPGAEARRNMESTSSRSSVVFARTAACTSALHCKPLRDRRAVAATELSAEPASVPRGRNGAKPTGAAPGSGKLEGSRRTPDRGNGRSDLGAGLGIHQLEKAIDVSKIYLAAQERPALL